MQRLRSIFAFSLALLVVGTSARAMSDPRYEEGSWRWRWSQSGATSGEEGTRALAVDRDRRRLAIGDDGGVALRNFEPPARERKIRVAEVRDLGFDAEGALWIASGTGLWRFGVQGRLEHRSPAPGEEVRSTRQIRIAGGLFVVATDGGAFLSVDGNRWLRLDSGFPLGPVTTVSIRERADSKSFEIWSLVENALWRVLVRTDPLRIEGVAKIPIRSRPSNELPVDLRTDLSGVDLAVIYPTAIGTWVASPPTGIDSWRAFRPGLPPGALINGLREEDGRLWLLTDRGLLHAAGFEGPWRRAGAPAGRAAISELASLEGRLFAASLRGLLKADYEISHVGRMGLRSGLAGADPPEPPIDSVHGAALRYLGLGVEKFVHAGKGLARRGWLPAVGLRFGASRDRTRSSDRDQSFLSGAVRHLQDRDRDRSLDLDASITLAWDLGDTAYDPEFIDLSREGRLVIALRDDVLDEVNQIYFERRSILDQLATPEDAADSDSSDAPLSRRNLELRAAELTAGLDAWTGGWFSRQLETHVSFREDARP